MGQEEILNTKEEKDLGVVIQDTLSPEQHINQIFGSTYRTLTNIRVAFHFTDKDMMKKILTSMIRPRLEYAAVVWSPHAKKDIRKLERIQRVATKMVPELREQYEDRLREMGLPTLQDRRERGDLITLYKIVNGVSMCFGYVITQRVCSEGVGRDVTPLVVAACSEADGTGSVVCVQPVSEGANTGSRA